MRVALVHDWLTGMRGGERCLLSFLKLYPAADIYTLVHIPGASHPDIDARVRGSSFLQHIPGIRRLYRYFLPLYPLALRSLRLKEYDLVISLSHSVVKNIRVPKGAVHICYCFTPMRYIRDQARQYFGRLTFLLYPLILALRSWDRMGTPDVFVAISRFISARIRLYYSRRAEVIYPPVESSWISAGTRRLGEGAFLYAGAMVPYKHPDLIVKAFNQLGEKLNVVGSGPMLETLKRLAAGNISFHGQVSDEDLASFYRGCRALIFPAREDFGMVPIECLAAGRPVIGLYEGALRESLPAIKPWLMRDNVGEDACGVFFRPEGSGDQAMVKAICESVRVFIQSEEKFLPDICKQAAERYSPCQFEKSWRNMLERLNLQRFMPECSC